MRSIDGRHACNAQNETDHAQHNPLKPFKMYFEKRRKRKNPTTAEQLGFYACNAQNETDHAQHNPIKPFKMYFEKRRKMKKPTTAKQSGFHAWVSPKRNGSKGRVRNRARAKIDNLPFLNSRILFRHFGTHSDSHSLMVSPKRFESWNNP